MLYAMTTTLSARGQIVLPKEIRDQRRLRTGDDFEIFSDEPGTIVLRRVNYGSSADLLDLLLGCPTKGFMKPPKRVLDQV